MNAGLRAGFLNAYPPSYFKGIESGKRLYSAIPQAAISAGLQLKTSQDLTDGTAISADITAQGWRDHLKLAETPTITPYTAGERMTILAKDYEFSLFEYWLSDYAGHEQDMGKSLNILANIDQILKGLLDNWEDQSGLIIFTSDHGNMEDISTRRHTLNPVPGSLIGAPHIRRNFIHRLKTNADFTPLILETLAIKTNQPTGDNQDA